MNVAFELTKAAYTTQSFNPGHRPKIHAGSIPIVAMNSLIAACGRGGHPDLALAVLNDMSSRFGIAPDSRSYRSAVIACNQAEHEHRRREKKSDQLDFPYSFRWWECALSLLRRMKESGLSPDIRTYSSAISACEAAGEWQRALGVLQSLMDEADDEDPPESRLNLYCFNAAISACEKGGKSSVKGWTCRSFVLCSSRCFCVF